MNVLNNMLVFIAILNALIVSYLAVAELIWIVKGTIRK